MFADFILNKTLKEKYPELCAMAKAVGPEGRIAYDIYVEAQTEARDMLRRAGLAGLQTKKTVALDTIPRVIKLSNNLGEMVLTIKVLVAPEANAWVTARDEIDLTKLAGLGESFGISDTWQTDPVLLGIFHGGRRGMKSDTMPDTVKWGLFFECLISGMTFLPTDTEREISRCIKDGIPPEECRAPNALGYFLMLWELLSKYANQYLEGMDQIGKGKKLGKSGLSISYTMWYPPTDPRSPLHDITSRGHIVDTYLERYGIPAWELGGELSEKAGKTNGYCTLGKSSNYIHFEDELSKKMPAIDVTIAENLEELALSPDWEKNKQELTTRTRKNGKLTEEKRPFWLCLTTEGLALNGIQLPANYSYRVSHEMIQLSEMITSEKMTADIEGRPEPYLSLYNAYTKLYGTNRNPDPEDMQRFKQLLVMASMTFTAIPWRSEYRDKVGKWEGKDYQFMYEDDSSKEWVPIINIRFRTDNSGILGFKIKSVCEWQGYGFGEGKYIVLNHNEMKTFQKSISRGIYGMTIYQWLREKQNILLRYRNQKNVQFYKAMNTEMAETLPGAYIPGEENEIWKIIENGKPKYLPVLWYHKTFSMVELAGILDIDISKGDKHRNKNMDRLEAAMGKVVELYLDRIKDKTTPEENYIISRDERTGEPLLAIEMRADITKDRTLAEQIDKLTRDTNDMMKENEKRKRQEDKQAKEAKKKKAAKKKGRA